MRLIAFDKKIINTNVCIPLFNSNLFVEIFHIEFIIFYAKMMSMFEVIYLASN